MLLQDIYCYFHLYNYKVRLTVGMGRMAQWLGPSCIILILTPQAFYSTFVSIHSLQPPSTKPYKKGVKPLATNGMEVNPTAQTYRRLTGQAQATQ